MLSDSLLRCEMIGCYPRAARCVYEASHEGPTKTMGAKINCLRTLIRYSQKKWANVLSGSGGGKDAVRCVAQIITSRLSPRALFRLRSNH